MHLFEHRVVPLLSLFCLLLASPALAQDGSDVTRSPSKKQTQLNEDGVRALAEGDHVRAISILEESLYLGEFNIAYLNLGRAYQLAGQCEKAAETLQKVDDALRVEEPSPGFVEAKAEQYLRELEESCAVETVTDEDSAASAGVTEPVDTDSTRQLWGIVATSTGGALMASAVGMHFLWAEPIRDDARNSTGGDTVRGISQQEYVDAESRANSVDTAALVR
jgi:hypothetical protein